MEAARKKINVEKAQNFMRQYRDPESRELKKLSANQFMDVWSHYDKDGNGFIEGTELDGFLREFVSSANPTEVNSELQVFDANKDGRLQLSEMAKLLPVKENFLCRQVFKGAKNLTKEDIERVFSLYDRDNNGTIENEELRGFLKDLLELAKKDYDAMDLKDFEDTILQGVNTNSDGKVSRKELTMILLTLAKMNEQ